MRAYIIRRLLLIVPSFLGITFVVFLIMLITPGDPTRLSMTADGGLETKAAGKHRGDLRALYGLDQPIYIQYVKWLRNIATFNFGKSYSGWRDIGEKIKGRIWITLALNVCALLVIYVVAIPIGVFAAVRQNSLADRLIAVVLFILYSIPAIWAGTMLMLYPAGRWGWFPLGQVNSEMVENMTFLAFLGDRAWHMVLPVVTLSYAGFASLSRYMRSGMLEVIRQDYIRTARAKGLREGAVIFRHALRNSLIPIVTISVMALPGLLGGSVIVEMIFDIPGMGLMMLEAATTRDYYTIMAVTTISAFLVLLALILADVLYAVVDPRISYD